MTQEHFEAVLQELLHRAPFVPFTVELQVGRRFEVDYPAAVVYRDGIAVFVAPGGAPIIFDHESVNHFVAAPASANP